jgi:hypothetical protein
MVLLLAFYNGYFLLAKGCAWLFSFPAADYEQHYCESTDFASKRPALTDLQSFSKLALFISLALWICSDFAVLTCLYRLYIKGGYSNPRSQTSNCPYSLKNFSATS